MPLVLSGTDGVSGVDGTASNPSYEGTDSNTGIFFPAADTIAFAEGGAEVARFDSAGNFGIGTSSPSTYGQLAVFRNTTDGTNANIAAVNAGTTASYAGFQAQAGTVNWQVFSDAAGNAIGAAGAMIRTISNHPLLFGTNNTERMRIDSAGNVGIGTTTINARLQAEAGTGVQNLRLSSASKASVNIVGAREGVGYWPLDIDAFGIRLFSEGNEAARIDTSRTLLIGTTTQIRGTISNTLQIQSSTTGQIVMRHAGQTAGRYWYMGVESGNDVFFIYPDGSGGVYMTRGATSWTGNSDERLKTDLKPIENAAEKITQLRTVTGRFKTDEENVSRAFLIAQDVQAVLPEAVDTKDDEDGTLGIRYTDTIPLLVAAIKELKAEIDLLKGNA